jgi:hypothetical protein
VWESAVIETTSLRSRAEQVLLGNRLEHSTKPSPSLYPHQWMWDSCFIAVGYSTFDGALARSEIRSLLRGQWSNGMVPQIIFNPASSGYFPGPDRWQSGRSPYAPENVQTSGITQPPLLAIAARAVIEREPDAGIARSFAAEVFPAITRYHEFLYRERDPDDSGLVTVVHPWESGLDNSPPYLDAGSRVELSYKPEYHRLDTAHVAARNRPTDKDYDLFIWLLEQMRDAEYDWSRYLPEAQLQVQDVLFNSVLCRANDDLAWIARYLEESDATARSWRDKTAAAIINSLRDEESGLFFSRDRRTGELLRQVTISSLMPLFAVQLEDGISQPPVDALADPALFDASGYRCPTTAISSSWFNPQNYWLGPVWINTNWMLRQGLLAHGCANQADAVRRDSLELVEKSGFREYFDPITGEGYGTDSFSWSAALTLDLLSVA